MKYKAAGNERVTIFADDLAALRAKVDEHARACFCVGPQNGEPLCPCRMRNVVVEDGRYIEVIDHGPAPKGNRK